MGILLKRTAYMLDVFLTRRMGWTCNILGFVFLLGFNEPIVAQVFFFTALGIFITILIKQLRGRE
jgi:hypothetical protein